MSLNIIKYNFNLLKKVDKIFIRTITVNVGIKSNSKHFIKNDEEEKSTTTHFGYETIKISEKTEKGG